MVAWQSLQLRIPWTLAACLVESIEMLLPLPDVIPGCPWHTRQLSSCLSGCGSFAWARAWACSVPKTKNRPNERSATEATIPDLPLAFAVRCVLFGKLRLSVQHLIDSSVNIEGLNKKGP